MIHPQFPNLKKKQLPQMLKYYVNVFKFEMPINYSVRSLGTSQTFICLI